MGESHEIAFEFDRAVPGLEGESRAPHQPEIRLEKGGVELIGDAGAPQHGLGLDGEALDRQDVLFAEPERRRRPPPPA